jgi:hypothetical protein
MLLLLNDLGMLGNDVIMAEEALLHRRNSGIWGPFRKRMAESAVDLLYPGMHPMAEEDRLLNPDVPLRIHVIKIEHDPKEKGNDPQPNISPPGFGVLVSNSHHAKPQSNSGFGMLNAECGAA